MIDKTIKDPSNHIDKLCHVEGWPAGCVFKLLATDGITHEIVTPKTGRHYKINKRLIYTRGQMQSEQHR